jgi:hypothetical protein
VPRSTSNVVTGWHTWKDIASTQSSTATHEDYLDPSQNRDDQYKLDAGRSHAASHTLRNDQEGGLLYTHLTNQLLPEHNMLKADMSRPPGSLCVYQYGHNAMHGVDLVSTDGTLHGLNIDHTGCFYSESLDAPYGPQSRQQGTESMFNDADYDSLGYVSASDWQSRLVDQDDVMDVLEPDENAADLPSWDMDSDQELTTWGNDLAGIGGRFADLDHHEYSRHVDLLVD